MGGVEYTLDCYDERYYEKSPTVNPVCLIPYNANCVMRGIREYNDLDNNVYGLYDLTWNDVSNYNGYSYFRIVEADNTIFNKDTIDEALYCPLIGNASKVTLFEHPKIENDAIQYKVSSDIYILFKSKNNDFYRCFFQIEETDDIFGGISKKWKIGWIAEKELNILPQKWYEN